MMFAKEHARRRELNDEVHARPPEPMTAPLRLSYLAMLCDDAERERSARALRDLADRFGVPHPAPGANHHAADFGPFRLKWETHTEFIRYTIVTRWEADDPFGQPAIAAVPADWLAGLPGRILVATHAALLGVGDDAPDIPEIAARQFGGNVLVGGAIAGGAGAALTDFRIGADGFGRLLVLDRGMNPHQAGRMVQRLLEVDTYRMMALLALPVARGLSPALTSRERTLAEVSAALVHAAEADEPVLLDRLTQLQAEIESEQSESRYRFGAAAAYYDLVRARIAELREERVQGLQTFQEFTERRMAPAMNTCRSVAARQEALSQRVAQATQLLSTRVDITRESQNLGLLESMNRRARLQLHLQSTVEGLSVAAVSYYIVGLVGYAAKALKAGGMATDPDLVMGASIPLVAGLVAFGVWRVRRIVHRP